MTEEERVIEHWDTGVEGPISVFIAGLHGNEPSGISALRNLISWVNQQQGNLTGQIYFVQGNVEALHQGKRFIDKDLNRIWNDFDLSFVERQDPNKWLHEHREMKDLKTLIDRLWLKTKSLYIFDLHTTSAPTIPFMVIEDLNQSLKLVKQFPIPAITNLRGYLNGTLLAHYSNIGASTLAFEAGDHHSRKSVIKHESFCKLALIKTGNWSADESTEDHLTDLLREELQPNHLLYELIDRYHIAKNETFRMLPGYSNFQRIWKGQELATNQNGVIESEYDANIFMPLYQSAGEDGFFVIRPLSVEESVSTD
jgi:succinylglutamate desuccinylase